MSGGAADGHDREAGVVLRPLDGLAEREACVALQEEVWGSAFADRVPASVLMIAQETGGVASGAFDGDRLVGFVFGITGLRDGRPVHWSDMLAVAAGYRGRGIGYQLKVHQRALLLGQGVETVVWTFDPLEAANAHLNLNRLGATAREYRRDVYGASDSPLHAGIGTDRWLAEWAIASERVAGRVEGVAGGVEEEPGSKSAVDTSSDPVDAPVLNPPESGGALPRAGTVVYAPGDGPAGIDADRVRVLIPSNVQRLKEEDPAAAVGWRANVRTALEGALAAGYVAVALERTVSGVDGSGAAESATTAAPVREGVAGYVLVRGFTR